jgi:hypothetical protein
MDIFAIAIEHPLDMMAQRFHPAARPDPYTDAAVPAGARPRLYRSLFIQAHGC